MQASAFLTFPPQTASPPQKDPARNRDEDVDALSRALADISRLRTALGDKELKLLVLQIDKRKNTKSLRQKVKRKNDKLKLVEESTALAKPLKRDAELLRLIKEAESKLKNEHTEHFENIFMKLAKAILEGKLPIDSIELEYICQLAVNLSHDYTNQFTYTDNFMRFCSALLKLKSGRAVLELLRAGSPLNASTSAQLVKDTHVNWHFPSENSILEWDKRNDIDPNFTLGVSEKTIMYMQDATEGIVRLGADATDCHGAPDFLPRGKFERGDVFFPGSGYDPEKLEKEYMELALSVEKYAANPSLIENASTKARCGFVANCMVIREFLQERILGMACNLEALRHRVARHREEYQKRQAARAQKKVAPKGTASTDLGIDQDEEELNAAQKKVLDKAMKQFDAAQFGIQVVENFLKECKEPQPVPYILASTVLNALREYFKTERDMACKIFEVRLCTVSPESSGTSYVIARYLLRDGTTIEEMRVIRAAVMEILAKSEFSDVRRRLELESADGEHFKLLWQLAEHPQSAIELWDQNDDFIHALRKQMIHECGNKALCTSVKVQLRKKYYAYYVRHMGLLDGFTIISLPRAATPIRNAVESLGFGSKVQQNAGATAATGTAVNGAATATRTSVDGATTAVTAGGKAAKGSAVAAGGKAAKGSAVAAGAKASAIPAVDDVSPSAGWFGRQELMWQFVDSDVSASEDEEALSDDSTTPAAQWYGRKDGRKRSACWDTWFQDDLEEFGKDGDVPYDKRIFSGAEIQAYLDLRQKLTDFKVGFEEFEDAVSCQNFNFLAKKAQSNSRVSTVQERLRDSAFYAQQAGDTKGSEKIELILSLLEDPALKDSDLISILMEVLPMDYLHDVIDIYQELQYNKVVWLPQRDGILGKTLCKHEDFFHKLKRVTSSVRTQQTNSDSGKKVSSKQPRKSLLDKAKLLEIALKKSHVHKPIIDALTGIGSDAMDPFAQSRMFVSESFYDDVHEADPNLALILRTIGEWYDAYDKTGLSGAERARRLSNMRELFDAVLGSYWYCHKKPPSNIAGMPLRLWFALAADCDSARVLVNVKLDREVHATAGQEDSLVGKKRRSEPFTNKPFKRPRLATDDSESPSAAQGHDAETFRLIRRLEDAMIKYRYIGTYDLEGGFSSLVMMVGFKPAIRIALGVLKKAQTLSFIRTMPQRGFWFHKSRRAKYDYAWGRSARGKNLVDEWFGLFGFVKQSKRDAQREHTLRQEVVLHAREFVKRKQTSKKAPKTDSQN